MPFATVDSRYSRLERNRSTYCLELIFPLSLTTPPPYRLFVKTSSLIATDFLPLPPFAEVFFHVPDPVLGLFLVLDFP